MSLRLGQALEAGSPGRAADLLVALLAPGRDARLAMLDADDEEGRLRIALDIINVRVTLMTRFSVLEVMSKICCQPTCSVSLLSMPLDCAEVWPLQPAPGYSVILIAMPECNSLWLEGGQLMTGQTFSEQLPEQSPLAPTRPGTSLGLMSTSGGDPASVGSSVGLRAALHWC